MLQIVYHLKNPCQKAIVANIGEYCSLIRIVFKNFSTVKLTRNDDIFPVNKALSIMTTRVF